MSTESKSNIRVYNVHVPAIPPTEREFDELIQTDNGKAILRMVDSNFTSWRKLFANAPREVVDLYVEGMQAARKRFSDKLHTPLNERLAARIKSLSHRRR